MNLKEKKIVFIDLDETLITTKSGKRFPEGVWDMELKLKVFDQLKKMSPAAIFIVSNQGGIQLNLIDRNLFANKYLYVISCMTEYIAGKTNFTFIAGKICEDNNESNENRKPNPGMLKSFVEEFEQKIFKKIDKKNCLMIGDASGLKDSFSDSDLKTAMNFGIDYLDVKEFEKLDIEDTTFNIYDEELNLICSDISEEEKKKFFEDKDEEEKKKYNWAPYRWIAPDFKLLKEEQEKFEKENAKKNKMKVVKK